MTLQTVIERSDIYWQCDPYSTEHWFRISKCSQVPHLGMQRIALNPQHPNHLEVRAVTAVVKAIPHSFDTYDVWLYSARMEFAYVFAKEPCVIEAWESVKDDVISIWAFVDDGGIETRLRVLKAQHGIMNKLPDIELDLYVLSLECKDTFLHEHKDAKQLYIKPL